MTFKEKTILLEKSMNLLIYTIQTVKVKWYQSGFFQFLMFGAVIVASVFTGGAAMAAYLAATAGSAAAITAMTVLVVTVISAVAATLTFFGMDLGVAGQIIGAAGIIAGGYAGIAQSTSNWGAALITAKALVDSVGLAHSILIQKRMENISNSSSELNAQAEAKQKQLDTLNEELSKPLLAPYKDNIEEISMYYNIAVGDSQSNYDVLYDYDIPLKKYLVYS